MQNWAIIFLVIGMIAGLLGFTGVAGGSSLTFMFLTVFYVMVLAGGVMLLMNWRRGRFT